MELKVGVKLSQKEVFDLLTRFDSSSDIPLHEGLDFDCYSKKLSTSAYFILAYNGTAQMGFIAYYLNMEGKFVYIPQVVVHKDVRHQGVGHSMFKALYTLHKGQYESVRLEVLKDNSNARKFYCKEGFKEIDDRDKKFLLSKQI